MIRQPPIATPTGTLCHCTTRCRARGGEPCAWTPRAVDQQRRRRGVERGAPPGDVRRLEGALPYRRRLPLRRRAADAGGGPRASGQRAVAVGGRALRGPRPGGHAVDLQGLRSAPPPPAPPEDRKTPG